ncbi:unnamed protein product [Pylaiella littoralis]
MTEFKRTVEQLAGIEELLGSLTDDYSTPAPEKLAAFSSAKASCLLNTSNVRLEDELSQKVAKFEKRLSETDPVSGTPRYGENMAAKYIFPARPHDPAHAKGGCPRRQASSAAPGAGAGGSRHKSRGFTTRIARSCRCQGSAEDSIRSDQLLGPARTHAVAVEGDAFWPLAARCKREAERRQEEEARVRIRLAEAEEERRRAVAAQSILERERERQTAEAERSREERQLAAEREEARLAEDKRRREREAQELRGSVAVGAAGVEDGLRRIDDACGGNPAEKKAAVQALQQILRNVASNPEDPRFRRIKRDNENFQRALGRFEGGIQILLSSGFKMQVEEGQTVLVMNEPDLSEDMDGWTEWYKHISEAVERLKLELDERF